MAHLLCLLVCVTKFLGVVFLAFCSLLLDCSALSFIVGVASVLLVGTFASSFVAFVLFCC